MHFFASESFGNPPKMGSDRVNVARDDFERGEQYLRRQALGLNSLGESVALPATQASRPLRLRTQGQKAQGLPNYLTQG